MPYKLMGDSSVTNKVNSNSLFMIFSRFTEIFKVIKPVIFYNVPIIHCNIGIFVISIYFNSYHYNNVLIVLQSTYT